MLKLPDAQWERIREHFPEESHPAERPGREPVPATRVLQAASRILNIGPQWHMLPQGCPNHKTAHRRFRAWCQNEVLCDVPVVLANKLRARHNR